MNISIATWNKTFGQEDSLRYPSRLEQALRRLRNTVELSLPSLQPRDEDAVSSTKRRVNWTPPLILSQVDALSFYESDNITEDARPAFKSPRVRESPFKITKSARKTATRSTAASTPGSRRASPKVRLRHDNSQIQFEPIVSSPSNPFNQESQVLTERQKEMIERQRLSGGLFANMGAPSPQPDAAPSPMELHSDALTADDLPMTNSRTTPLKALAAMGPMDVFLGSSPTPHARKSTRHIVSDDTSLATPTAVRTVKLTNNDDLGSSPPRFEKDNAPDARRSNSDVLVGSSFEYRQPETPYDMSFDEGTTIDEDALLDAMAEHAGDGDRSEIEPPSDVVMSDIPSWTIDLQLTAQLDADIQAQTAAATEGTDPAPESNSEFVDATSHPQSSMANAEQAGGDTEVDDSEPPSSMVKKSRSKPEADTSSTSRVGDSFSSNPRSNRGTPQSQRVRRSFRNSATPSPLLSLDAKKRKSAPARTKVHAEQSTVEEPEEEPTPTKPASAESSPQLDSGGMLDNIVVAISPKKRQVNSKKRKPRSDAQVVITETHSKRGPVRRSQSLLSQVENSQDVLVEDTPAPKRARQSASQDVSEAKPPSQTKRLSHVQVTPKRSSESGRGSSLAGSTPIQAPALTSAPAPIRPEAEPSQTSQPAGVSTPSRSFKERVILTPRSIINQLKSLSNYLFSAPQLVLGREEEREMDNVLFDIRRRVHAAGVRGEDKEDKEEGEQE